MAAARRSCCTHFDVPPPVETLVWARDQELARAFGLPIALLLHPLLTAVLTWKSLTGT